MEKHKLITASKRIMFVLLMYAVATDSALTPSSTQRILRRLDDLESHLQHLEDRMMKETQYRREDVHFMQEQLDKIKYLANISAQEENNDNGKNPNTIFENEISVETDVCDRIKRAFPKMKKDVYDKILGFENKLNNHNESRLKEFKEGIQMQFSLYEHKINDVSRMIETVSHRMRSEIALISDKLDHIAADTSDVPNTSVKPLKPLKPTNCQDITEHGVVTIYPDFEIGGIQVFCDQQTDGGGWIVFQRRQDGDVDFYRRWKEYEDGFGSIDGEFWLGNKNLHLFTRNLVAELRIDMVDFEGNSAYAQYADFRVGPTSDQYRLSVGRYSGTAGDGLTNDKRDYAVHDGHPFSTLDNDNDKYSLSCAKTYVGGWWYNQCFDANLNGKYYDSNSDPDKWQGIIWYPWKGSKYSLKSVDMKMRFSLLHGKLCFSP